MVLKSTMLGIVALVFTPRALTLVISVPRAQQGTGNETKSIGHTTAQYEVLNRLNHIDKRVDQKYNSEQDKTPVQCLETGMRIIATIGQQKGACSPFQSLKDLKDHGFGPETNPTDCKMTTDGVSVFPKKLIGQQAYGLEVPFEADHDSLKDMTQGILDTLSVDGSPVGWHPNGWRRWKLENARMWNVHFPRAEEQDLNQDPDDAVEKKPGILLQIYTNAAAGIIYVSEAYTPDKVWDQDVNKWRQPKESDLRRLSDVAFILLKAHAHADNRVLRFEYMIRARSVNERSVDCLNEIIKEGRGINDKTLADYSSGMEFNMGGSGMNGHEDRYAKQLLGTPNGVASGYILIDRPEEFRGRTVKAVRVFGATDDPEYGGQLCLAVSIGKL